jgi:hypothetical protein
MKSDRPASELPPFLRDESHLLFPPTHSSHPIRALSRSSASGQHKRFKSFATNAGSYKERCIHPCDDYCAVPLPVLHRAADQLQRYLADGLAV